MALKPLNSVAGFSVGETPANIILANGDITTNNITTTGVANLNSLSNVKITGGSAGQVISTDGAGNLSFITVSTAGLSNGTSNIAVLNNGNVTISSNGVANVVVISDLGQYVTGILSVTGNANIGNIGTAGIITATGTITGGNLATGGTLSAGGNANVGNLGTSGLITATGNIQGANLVTGGVLSATGNANVGNLGTAGLITATGNIQGANVIGSNVYVSSLGSGQVAIGYTAGQLVGGPDLFWDFANADLFSTGFLSNRYVSATGNVTGGNIVTGGVVTATGNVTAGNVTTGGVVTATGNVTGGNITTTGLVTATGNVTGGNLVTSGALSVTGNANIGNIGTAGLITATGNIDGGNINTAGLVSATGNVSGGNITTAGVVTATGNVTGGNITTAGVVTATGNVTGGNLTTAGAISATGNANVGNIGATEGVFTGNISALNANLGNLAIANFINVSSNLSVTGTANVGNLRTDNLLYANGQPWDLQQPGGSNTQVQFNDSDSFGGSANFTFDKTTNILKVTGNANITSTTITNQLQLTSILSTHVLYSNGSSFAAGSANFTFNDVTNLLSVNGNVSAGNLVTGGVVTATGNVDGGNINTAGVVSATGNVTGGNVNTTGLITATGNVTGGNINTAGVVSATGNVTGGNLVTSGTVYTANANITGVVTGNLIPSADITYNLGNSTNKWNDLYLAGNSIFLGTITLEEDNGAFKVPALSVTGNANIGNIGTGGLITATGNIDGGNINTSGVITATGNVSGGNLTTSGLVTATGNVTGGNLTTTGLVTATGNINGGNITTAGLVTATGNITGGNLTTAGLVSASGNVEGANITTAGVVTATGNIISNANVVTDLIVGRTSSVSIAATGVDQDIFLKPTGNGVVDVWSKRISNVASPTSSNDAATKGYVDAAVEGLNVHDAAYAATSANLATLTGGTITYNNGTGGVGANLVLSGSPTKNFTSANTFDGNTTATVGSRILVKSEANAAHNGVYVVDSTTVMTRATDYNSVPEVEAGDFIFVQDGDNYNDTGWVQTSTVTTIGTDPINFTQFSGAGTYSAGTGLTLTGSVFSISNTTVTAASYGNGDTVATFTVNAQGQLTAAANVVITANAGNLTGTTLNSSIVTSSLTAVGTLANLAVTGNITAANIYANSGTIGASLLTGTLTTSAQPNITSTGTLSSLSVSGNANIGNIGTAGLITATGNVTGGNLTTAGEVSATGNITGNYILGNGSQLTNVAASTALTANTVTDAAQPNITSVGILSSVSVSGNANIGNIGTGGLITATGNVTGGNLTTGGVVTATGNVSGGNLTTVGVVTATGSITGGNLITTGNANVNIINLGNGTINTKLVYDSVTTTSVTANQTIASLSTTGITGLEFLVKGEDSGGKYSVATVQAVTDGTNVDYAVFGTVQLGGYTGSLAVNIVGGFVRLQVTPASSNSTVWTTQARTI